MRPVLPSALRRVWRDHETLQLGRQPGPTLVLAGLDPGARAALSLLDGTRDTDRLRVDAASAGCPPERLEQLLTVLADAGVLRDGACGWPPPPPRAAPHPESERLAAEVAALQLVPGVVPTLAGVRRGTARVRVLGAGRVGAAVAQLLATAGVAAVDVDDGGPVRPHDTGPAGPGLTDVGRVRGQAVRDRLLALAPSVDLSPGAAHLVVLCPADDTGLDDLLGRVDAGAAHLLAEARDGAGVVGPLVLPGSTACLRCLDLSRADLDPDWPALAAQLARPGRTGLPADAVLATAVAAQAAAQVLGLLDGGSAPAALDGTLELAAHDWRWRRRSWAPHRDCGCVRVAG